MPLTFSRKRPEEIKNDLPEFVILKSGSNGASASLSAYRNALADADACGIENIILPLMHGISADNNENFRQACEACIGFLYDHETNIIISTDGVTIKPGRADIIAQDHDNSGEIKHKPSFASALSFKKSACAPRTSEIMMCEAAVPLKDTVDEYIKNTDKGFSETLLELIDKSGMTDVQCYKRANIDRKLFSKIRSTPDYKPRKTTALSFCIALSLSLEQTKDLLEKAGYALSKSNRGDLIVEYYITHGKYDIYEINETLFEYDQALLGA